MKNKKVLIVDDNALNRKVFENIIGYSYFFDVAVNGREALDKIKNDHFDIILMDMQMPEMDGYSATSLLRRKGYAGPIVALTAHAMAESREQCMRAGCDDHATKPINKAALLELCRRWVEESRAAA